MKNTTLNLIIEYAHEYSYLIISFISGSVYVIWKGFKKRRDALGTVAVAVILGAITFKGIEGVEITFGEANSWYLAVLYNAKGSIVALVALTSELIYKILIAGLMALPKIVARKFNIKNDCKIDKEE